MIKNEFETKSLGALGLKYILPSIFGMLFVCLQSMIDGMFIGNFVGETALASITINAPIMQLVNAMVMVVAIGGQSLVSIKIGQKNEKSAQDVYKSAFLGLLSVSVVMMILGVTLSKPLVRLLGADESLVENSASYLFSIAWFLPFLGVWFLSDAMIRIMGKPIISFIAMACGAGTNILLDYIFINLLGWGVKGAGIATGISFVVGFLVCALPFFNPKFRLNIFKGRFKFKYFWRLSYNGASEGVNSLAGAVIALAYNIVLMKHAGAMGVAAYTAIMYMMQIGFCFMFGTSDGMRPIIGYNYGAKNIKRIRQTLSLECVIAMACGVVVFFIMFFAGGNLARIFVQSDELIKMAADGAKIMAFGFLISWVNIVASGFYTAIDFARESIIIALMRGLVFSLIGVFVLPLIFGMNGIWATTVFAETASFVVVAIMFGVQLKKGKILKKEEKPEMLKGGLEKNVD